MAQELDALSLSITASTADAVRKIDDLITSLKNLDTRFRSLSGSTTYANNLETAVHSITRINNAISNIDDNKLKSVASALKSLGTAGNNLANFGNVSQAGKAMDTVSAKAENMAKSLAASFKITDKDHIDSLTASIRTMINTMGKGEAFYAAEDSVKRLIEDYGLFENKLHDVEGTYEKVRNIIRQQPLYVPDNFSANANWLSDLATIGIKNTTHDKNAGVSAGYLASQLESLIPALQGLKNESDIISTIANHLRDATSASISFAEATKTGQDADAWYRLNEAVRQTEQSLGIVSPTMEEIDQYLKTVNFDAFSTGAEQVNAMRQATYEYRDSLQAAATTVQELSNALQQSQQNAQPFDKIVNGLSQLEDVHIGDFSNISVLAEGVNKLGYQSAINASQTLPLIADGLRQFENFTLPELGDMDSFSRGLRSLGSKAVQNAASALPFVADGLKQLKSVGDLPKSEGLQEFAQALSIFGRSTAAKAVETIPQLSKAFNQLFTAMSKAPTISRNTIDAANAMANLASKTGGVTRALNDANPKLSLWSSNANRAAKSSFSLASAIGKIYASYWMLFRAFGMIKKSIDIASDLTEVRNVVVQAFGDMAYKANEFADIAGESFGMSKLQALDAASRYQAMGKTMGITDQQIIKANEYLNAKLSDTLALSKVQQGYSDLGDTAADMSINLTKLAGDLASLYNTDIDVAAEKLNSIFTGTTKPLREFGFDLTQATLQEWAMKEGIDANVKSMTQAEKAVLRYQYVMANADFVMGDFARTSESWHNSIVRLKLAFQNLGSVIGQGFINLLKPAVQKITAFVNTLTKLVEKAINAIGKLLGWQIQIDPVKPTGDIGGGGSGMDDMEDAANGAGEGAEETADAMDDADKSSENTADNLDKAQKAAKKMKDYLLGIDELNVFQPDTETDTANKDKTKKEKTPKDKGNKGKSGGSGAGKGGGASEGGADGGNVSFKPYQSMIDSWYDLGKTIADTIGDALWGIDWKAIQAKAEKAASRLAEFLNGIFASKKLWTGIGHTIAEGLNTALAFLETFVDRFNWGQMGRRIGDMINQAVADFKWEKLGRTLAKYINAAFETVYNFGLVFDAKKLGEGIASSINSFFSTLDPKWIARGLNIWVDKIKELFATIITKTDWGEALKKIGELFSELDLDTLLILFGAVAWKLGGKALTNKVIQELLITTVLGGLKEMVLAIPKLLIKFGALIFSGLSATSIASSLSQTLMTLKVAIPQILKLYIVEPFTTFISGTAIPAITSALGSVGSAVGLTGSAAILGGAAIIAAAIATVIAIICNWDKIKKMNLGETLAKEIKFAFLELPKKLGNLGTTVGSTVGKAIKSGLEFAFIKVPQYLAEQASKIDFKNIFHGIGEKIGSVIGNYVKLGIAAIVGMLSLDGGVIVAINNFISNMVESFIQAVANTDWSQIGINILKGIVFIFTLPGRILGIIGEAIAGLFTGIYDGVCQAFGISSPAEKMKPLGEYILLGIVSGFTSKISEFSKALLNWYNNAVKPWFTLDKWKALGINIVNGLMSKWNEFVGQWKTSIGNWWNQNVVPWLKLDKWKTEADHIKVAIISKFTETVNQWIIAIGNWWNQNVVPWLKLDKWKAEADHIREAIITKFNETVKQWIIAIGNWWNQNVVPWLKLDKWKAEADHIREAIITKFTETVRQWAIDIANWWNQHVVPWLDIKKWKAEADHIRDAIVSKLSEMISEWAGKISNWWSNNVVPYFSLDKWKELGNNVKNGIINAIDEAIGEWKGKVQEFVKSFQDVFKESTFKEIGTKCMNAVLDGFKAVESQIKTWAQGIKDWIQGLWNSITINQPTSSDTQQSSSNNNSNDKKKKSNTTKKKASGGILVNGDWRNIHAYGSGGIPDEGQLFWARESGAELVGQIGGNTAVMNNDQIVASVSSGVQQAVTEALAPYLADISRNTKTVANKDFSIQIGDRQIAEANNRGQRQLGAVLFT